jgi:hypothetical protein
LTVAFVVKVIGSLISIAKPHPVFFLLITYPQGEEVRCLRQLKLRKTPSNADELWVKLSRIQAETAVPISPSFLTKAASRSPPIPSALDLSPVENVAAGDCFFLCIQQQLYLLASANGDAATMKEILSRTTIEMREYVISKMTEEVCVELNEHFRDSAPFAETMTGNEYSIDDFVQHICTLGRDTEYDYVIMAVAKTIKMNFIIHEKQVHEDTDTCS